MTSSALPSFGDIAARLSIVVDAPPPPGPSSTEYAEWSTTRLAFAAALLESAFTRIGWQAAYVGGGVLQFHLGGEGYQTGDLDMVVAQRNGLPVPRATLDEVMRCLGGRASGARQTRIMRSKRFMRCAHSVTGLTESGSMRVLLGSGWLRPQPSLWRSWTARVTLQSGSSRMRTMCSVKSVRGAICAIHSVAPAGGADRRLAAVSRPLPTITMSGRLPQPTLSNAQEALTAFWAERRALARAAKSGLDFTGAARPARAATERDWLLGQAAAGGPAERESSSVLDAPPGRRRRRI
jgi:hypothetical protein